MQYQIKAASKDICMFIIATIFIRDKEFFFMAALTIYVRYAKGTHFTIEVHYIVVFVL